MSDLDGQAQGGGPSGGMANSDRKPAPIALFVHSRADHAARTLAALAANVVAARHDLHVFSDAARRPAEEAAVDEVRALARGASGFRSVAIVERETNWGLAANITDGVTQLVERYGRVIVVEDDLVTSPYFLSFMNEALDRYEDQPEVWHVNGWTYPIRTQEDDRPFFSPVMECWGWATWRDRWRHFRRDPEGLVRSWDKPTIRRFNIDGGYDYWGDIRRNAQGVMTTWAAFWYATIFERGGLCLSPATSFVINIGIDGSGSNSGSRDIYVDGTLATHCPAAWPTHIKADRYAHGQIREFLLSRRAPLWKRVGSRVKWTLKRAVRRVRGN